MASRRMKRTGSTEVIYKDLEFRSKSFHPVASRQRSNEHAQTEFANVYRDSAESEIGLRATVRLKLSKKESALDPTKRQSTPRNKANTGQRSRDTTIIVRSSSSLQILVFSARSQTVAINVSRVEQINVKFNKTKYSNFLTTPPVSPISDNSKRARYRSNF